MSVVPVTLELSGDHRPSGDFSFPSLSLYQRVGVAPCVAYFVRLFGKTSLIIQVGLLIESIDVRVFFRGRGREPRKEGCQSGGPQETGMS